MVKKPALCRFFNSIGSMKVYSYLIFILWVLVSCCFKTETNDVQLLVVKKEADPRQLLLLSDAKNLFGIDTNTDTVSLTIQFSTYINYGSIAEDGTIYLADQGKQLGMWGEQILVLNPACSLQRCLTTLPNPINVRIIGPYLFADSGGYYENGGYTAYTLFMRQTGKKLLEDKTLANAVGNNRTWIYNNTMYLGINPMTAQNRKSYFIKKNIANLDETKEYGFTARYPYYFFFCSIWGQYLFIIYRDFYCIDIFNLETSALVKTIDLKTIPELKTDSEQSQGFPEVSHYFIQDPLFYNNKLALFITDHQPDLHYQSIAWINLSDFSLESVLLIHGSPKTQSAVLESIQKDKIYLHDIQSVSIFSADNGQVLKTIDLF